MATTSQQPPESALIGEEALLAQKYAAGSMKKPGMNNILQKRLNKGQKYFDSGDYNMAKAKTPGGLPKGQAQAQTGGSTENPEQAQAEPVPSQPDMVDQQSAEPVDESQKAAADAAESESTAKSGNTSDQQRSYPRKAIPAASPLTMAPAADTVCAPVTLGQSVPVPVPVGGIPHPRALSIHHAHPTHTGPFVTHPERASPTDATSPLAADADRCPQCN